MGEQSGLHLCDGEHKVWGEPFFSRDFPNVLCWRVDWVVARKGVGHVVEKQLAQRLQLGW